MRHYLYTGAIAITFALACNQTETKEESTQTPAGNEVSLSDEQQKNIDLQVGEAGSGEIAETLRLQGRIEVPPQNLLSVSVPLGGYLKSIKLLPGSPVRKGQLIAVLEDIQYIQLQQDFLSTRHKLDYASKELARQKELNASQANSDKTLQQAEREYQNLKVEHSALIEKLKLININPAQLSENKISRTIHIYSPIQGQVSRVHANIGKYVASSDVIMELIDPSDIHLSLTIFERDLSQIDIGQRVLAYSNAQPDKKYETKVTVVSHHLSEGRSEVHCHFENADKDLIPGMYMNAELQTKNRQVQFLPEEAVVGFENKEYVFVEKTPRTFHMEEVQTGESANGQIAILNDLTGKRLAIKGAYSLLMKLKNTEEEP